MDVKQMLYIVTIAKEGGISRAAAKLFITQSALDQQLLKLEHELGIDTYAVNWPIGCGKEFQGVYDREKQRILFFQEKL